MTVLSFVLLAVPVAGWLTVQLATGGWRRILIRSQWARICRAAGVAVRRDRETRHKTGPGEKINQLQAVEHTPVLLGLFGRPVGRLRDRRLGATWKVWAAVGQSTAEFAAQADRLASTTWCRRCVIEPRTHRSARITFLWRDPFTDVRPWYPPTHGRLHPAFDINGQAVDIPILDTWGGSTLIGAASGSGKSAWVNAIVSDLVRQRAGTVVLVGVDLKRVELGPWSPAFARVARTATDADGLFAWIRAFIDARVIALEAAGLRQVPDTPTEEWPYLALVIDELGALLNGRGPVVDDRKALLGEIAMLARAAGVILIVAVQRPTTDIVPGQIRDNCARRVLLRVANLDQGQATLGWRPTQADIDQLDTPGLALVDLPGRQPFLARSTYGEVDDVARTATEAHQ